MDNRDVNIDLIRFIGIMLIMLAHVYPPSPIYELRLFDVPLMLFVSGLAFAKKTVDFSWQYLWHRFTRLVFPVWIFFAAYFVLIFSLKYIVNIDLGVRTEHVVGSFLLTGGIGFVWIIRVFLMIAIITPFLIRIKDYIKSDMLFCIALSCFIVIQHLLLSHNIGTNISLFSDYIYYAIGYSVFFLIGLKFKNMHLMNVLLFLFSLSIAYLVYLYVSIGHVANGMDILKDIDYGKYPPHLGYSIYGLWGCCITYWLVNIKHRTKLPSVIDFIGSNTIWIYLYHIPFVQFMWLTKLNWVIQYVFVIVMAVSVAYFQSVIVRKLQNRYNWNVLKYLKG